MLAACGAHDSTETVDALVQQESSVDRADFTTSTSIAQNPAPDVKVTVSGDGARSLYAATLALPLDGGLPRSCPADFGVTYTVVFWSGSTQVATAVIAPNGCESVQVSSSQGALSLDAASSYFDSLAADLGIEESTIYPYTLPSS
jgi:hypothetical protein